MGTLSFKHSLRVCCLCHEEGKLRYVCCVLAYHKRVLLNKDQYCLHEISWHPPHRELPPKRLPVSLVACLASAAECHGQGEAASSYAALQSMASGAALLRLAQDAASQHQPGVGNRLSAVACGIHRVRP